MKDNPELHVEGQMDQINPFCFSVVCLFRNYPHRLMSFIMSYMFLSVVLLYRCFRCLYRKIIQSIGIVEESVSIETNVTHPNEQHPTTRQSDTTEVCVYLNSDHGVLQSPLCEFVDLGSPPTYVILDSGCTVGTLNTLLLVSL